MLHGRLDFLGQKDGNVRIGRYMYHTFDYAILRSDFFEDLMPCALSQRGWTRNVSGPVLSHHKGRDGAEWQWSSHLAGICDGPEALCARNMSLRWQWMFHNGSTSALPDDSHAEDARTVYKESPSSRCVRHLQICGCEGERMSLMLKKWLWPPTG